jgi:hypothetical protein
MAEQRHADRHDYVAILPCTDGTIAGTKGDVATPFNITG